MFSIETKIFICFVWALIVFLITALLLGSERKAIWFQKRTKYSFFNRRGLISEALHFCYPKTQEGYCVTAAMTGAIGVVGYVLYIL